MRGEFWDVFFLFVAILAVVVGATLFTVGIITTITWFV